MKHLKSFNENNIELGISGLKCDNPNCDYNDPTVPLSDYEKSINKPCPKCGESLLTQDDFDQTMQMVKAVELMNKMTPEEIEKLSANLSEEEIDSALDMMNKLKMRKESDNEDGTENWSASVGKDIRPPKNEKMSYIKRFNEEYSSYPTMDEVESASHEQICSWYRHLPSPGKNLSDSLPNDEFKRRIDQEAEVMNAICAKYKEGGGFNPSLSKKIGW